MGVVLRLGLSRPAIFSQPSLVLGVLYRRRLHTVIGSTPFVKLVQEHVTTIASRLTI
jgi:hypothetical protein